MKLIKSLFAIAFVACFSVLAAQTEDYYLAPMPDAGGSNYLFYKPDSNFKAATTYNNQLSASQFKPVISNYGERVAIYETEDYQIETDRSNAVYFKAKKNSVRVIFLKKYTSDAACWGKGAVVFAKPAEKDKNILEVYVAQTGGKVCKEKLVEANIETTYADATGTQPPSFIEKVAEKISLVDEKRALLIKLPREHLKKLVSVNFRLYDKRKKLVKEFINMKAAENVLYINDLRKGKYTYKVEVYDGTLIKEGEIILKK